MFAFEDGTQKLELLTNRHLTFFPVTLFVAYPAAKLTHNQAVQLEVVDSLAHLQGVLSPLLVSQGALFLDMFN